MLKHAEKRFLQVILCISIVARQLLCSFQPKWIQLPTLSSMYMLHISNSNSLHDIKICMVTRNSLYNQGVSPQALNHITCYIGGCPPPFHRGKATIDICTALYFLFGPCGRFSGEQQGCPGWCQSSGRCPDMS